MLFVHFEISAQKQKTDDANIGKRYKNDLFTNIDSLIDLPYGEAINLKGENEKLLLNLFMPPVSDTIKKRPLVIFIHGGGFRNNNKWLIHHPNEALIFKHLENVWSELKSIYNGTFKRYINYL